MQTNKHASQHFVTSWDIKCTGGKQFPLQMNPNDLKKQEEYRVKSLCREASVDEVIPSCMLASASRIGLCHSLWHSLTPSVHFTHLKMYFSSILLSFRKCYISTLVSNKHLFSYKSISGSKYCSHDSVTKTIPQLILLLHIKPTSMANSDTKHNKRNVKLTLIIHQKHKIKWKSK